MLLDAPVGMLFASRDFARTAQKRLDHVAEDPALGLTDLMARYGSVDGRAVQLVSLGSASAVGALALLVIGDGNPARPDRQALFAHDFRCCSAASIDHPVYGTVTQILLSVDYTDKPHHEQRSEHNKLWHPDD